MSQMGADAARLYARHTIVDQLTFDPNMGFTGQLPSDGAVILAWSTTSCCRSRSGVDAAPDGERPLVLPTEIAISGTTTFRTDLLRSTVISSDAAFFSKDPFTINFGRGTAEMAYRPIAFDGTFQATQLAIGLNFGDRASSSTPRSSSHCPASRSRARIERSRAARSRTSTGCPSSSCTI